MKTILIFYLSLLLLCLFWGCDTPDSKTKVFHQVYNPCKKIVQYDSLEININDEIKNEILLFVDSTHIDFNIIDGVYATFITDTIYFSYGIRDGSASFDLLNYNDEINENLDWDYFLTLNGHILHRGFKGNIEYLGFKKKNNKNWNYGWLEIETTESTLCLKEFYYDENGVSIRAGVIN